jgi:hypothetical protein
LETLKKVMAIGKNKIAYIAMEKRLHFIFFLSFVKILNFVIFSFYIRYVFTISDLDCVAPCYDYFRENLFRVMSGYQIDVIDTKSIPQYFCYEKVKELVLFRIKKRH